MATAKCFRCGSTATGETFEQASSKINHVAARSHGVKCGTNFANIKELTDKKTAAKLYDNDKPVEKTPKPKKSKKSKKEEKNNDEKQPIPSTDSSAKYP